jgi:hypothetical protein
MKYLDPRDTRADIAMALELTGVYESLRKISDDELDALIVGTLAIVKAEVGSPLVTNWWAAVVTLLLAEQARRATERKRKARALTSA